MEISEEIGGMRAKVFFNTHGQWTRSIRIHVDVYLIKKFHLID